MTMTLECQAKIRAKTGTTVVRMSQGIVRMEKPKPSDPRRSLCSRNCMAVTVTLVALSSLAIFVVFWCTNIFRDAILSGLEIRNGTSMFDWWQRPPVRAVYRVRVFNYTNIEDFEAGRASRLNVHEVGPYVYRETLSRVNPRINDDDGTATYQEKRSFQWEGGSPDDEVVRVPNVALLAATAFTRDMSFMARMGVTAVLTTLQAKTFIDVPAGGYLWGYDDKIFEMAKPIIALQEELPFQHFGVLAIKSGVSRNRITVNTGQKDINEVGLITKINDNESRNIWGDEECDKVDGTDGSVFPPRLFATPNATLKIYAPDMCRALTLEYQGEGNVYGIPTLTYKPPVDALTSSSVKDHCFCSKASPYASDSSRTCPPAGIFNTSACSFNMPFLASFPHFYGGDPRLLDNVDGLHPSAELHESVVQIHPRLGVPIGGHSRLQVNIEVRRAIGVPFLGNLKDGTILPLVWVEVAIDNVPETLLNLFHHAYFTAGAVEACMKWASLVGIFFCVCTVICMLK